MSVIPAEAQPGVFKRARIWVAPVATVATHVPDYFVRATSSTGEVVQDAHHVACAGLGLQLLLLGGRALYRKIRDSGWITITLGKKPDAGSEPAGESSAPALLKPSSVPAQSDLLAAEQEPASENREHAA